MSAALPKDPEPAQTVLIVDDDETHRLLARDCLEAEGFKVLEASDGEAGLNVLREQGADLVLLDIMMPGRDGYSVCREIRADPSLSEVPVIMVTGAEDLNAVHRVFSAKADDFVTKPVHWPLLPYRVRFTLRRRDDAAVLREALTQLRAADEAKAQFLAAMGHELRTPLNAIIGFSDIIANNSLGPAGGAKYTEYGTYILEGGKRLLTMINAILDMVKLQNKKVVLLLQSMDVAAYLESMQDKYQRLCDAACHTFHMRCENPLPEVSADPSRIGQIVDNLLANAIKFTPAGGAIEIAAVTNAEGGVDISVADSGIGMDARDIEIALQPFRQVDGSLARTHEGAGLGLSIAKALAELHAGSLSITSEKGHGTVVTLHLPSRAANPADVDMRLSQAI